MGNHAKICNMANRRMSSDSVQFLYRIQPVRPDMLTSGATEDETKIVSQHYEYLKQLTSKGTVLLAGRTRNTDNSSFGIVLFNADSEEMARKIVNEDPAVKNRIFRAELFPYRMALFNPRNSREMLGTD